MDDQKMLRRHMVISGSVQGVGFRYRALYAAQLLGLTGWVQNEWDGTVVMEVQGVPGQIDRMLAMIGQGNYVQIENVRAKDIPLLEQERGFDVRG